VDTRQTTATALVLRFGTFEFRPARMLLLDQGKAVRLGNRALDILHILIERAGEVVTKEELIEYTWPTTVVEEGNLRVHIGALRRVLRDGEGGSRYIVNVIGRGYSFVAEVRREEENEADLSPSMPPSSRQNDLPAPLTRMLGRSEDVTALLELLRSSRLVTVVGPGGVGKSTLALDVASSLVDSHRERARFVDLAAIADPALVPQSCATAIGMVVPATTPVPSLVAFLRDKEMLLLLDNCEHVIDAAAAVTEAILKGAPAMRVLATSREPLRIQGERQHRLHPLHIPPADENMTAASARQYPSVELFAERASTTNARAFDLTDANAHWVADICRRLDGIPLAIELAAARVGLLGARDLLARLAEQLFSLTAGRRTGAARHQTLRAALDWSYSLLSAQEQAVLRRLSVFSAAFTLDSAVAVAAGGTLSEAQVVDAMMSLAEKSLLTADTDDPDVRYRLLQTTQSYAQEKLASTDDSAHIFHWHAHYVLKLLRRGETDWERMSRAEWVKAYDHAVDDVRAALQWAFATHGDLDFTVELTIAAVPFAFQMALTEEIRDRLAWVLQRITALAVRQPALEARVSQALDALNNNMEAARRDNTNTGALREDVLRGDLTKHQVGPLVQLTIIQIEDGEYRAAVESAGRLGEVARAAGDAAAELVADRVMAQAQHFLGNHAVARTLVERVMAHPAKSVPLSYVSVQVDRRVSMRIVLARIHWISGYPDQAMEVLEEALQYSGADTPFAVCQALALAACPVAFWRGDYAALARFVPQLIEQAERFRLGNWRAYGECYARLVTGSERSDTPDSRANQAEIVRLASDKRLLRHTVATAAPDLMGWTVDEPDSAEGWCAPELLRIQAEQLLATQPPQTARARAETLLRQSLELARSQGAAAWGLRTAASLSSLYEQQDRGREARATLSEALEHIVGGDTTRDVMAARAQLAKL
jgi:predicted ATPase/DNA-binding winged helix-turn-helix (wHTH) protein